MDTVKTKLNCLNQEETKKLSNFLKEQFGLEKVLYIMGDGPDVRITTYEGVE